MQLHYYILYLIFLTKELLLILVKIIHDTYLLVSIHNYMQVRNK